MNPEPEMLDRDPMFEEGYPHKVPKVYLEGHGEAYSPQYCFDWDDDSVVLVRDKHVLRYTRSSFVELLAKNEEGEIVWMDGRRAPYSNCWDGEYLNDNRSAYEYTIIEFDLNELKKKKYKVVLEEENCLDNWDLEALSKYGVAEIVSHFEIKDGVLLQYVGEERDIIIPDGVKEIGENAFKGCGKFNSIKISKTVEKISCLESGWSRAEYLEVDEDNPKYYIQDGCLIDKEEKELVWAFSGDTIPDDGSVVKIGSKAFCYRSDLSKIVIPDAIIAIGDNAFSNCVRLENITLAENFANDAKRIFGRTLERDDEKDTYTLKRFKGFTF
jgi:hypothetical protein